MIANRLCALLLASLRPEKASPALLIICAIILAFICAAGKNILIFASHQDAAHLPAAIAPIAFLYDTLLLLILVRKIAPIPVVFHP